MIRTWKLVGSSADEIDLPDRTSLDSITRQLPEGYYSTFRTYDSCTRVIGFRNHLKRLPDIHASSLRRQLLPLLEPYRPGEARVRLMETRGGELYISIEPLKRLPRKIYERGVRVETTTIQRDDPRTKSTVFIGQSAEEKKHIAQMGIFEALLVKNGRILEGMTSNFFYVPRAGPGTAKSKRAILHTARTDILLGVTRTMVIRAARARGVETIYSPLPLDQLPALREAFITSSSRGIVPVIQIDEVMVGQGVPGKLTQTLMAAYEEYVLEHAEEI